MLCAWAAEGPNDMAGQELLAEALRIDPSAKVAQMAFERMEGIEGAHGELDATIAKYGIEQLEHLESEMRRPSFRRAQMGFNNNVRLKELLFHVQTEDSGLDQPHIVTHLFVDGGRIIKSHKRSYAEQVPRDDVAEHVRSLMKAQHLEMVAMLREGRFDDIIAGREVGGMQVFTEPPALDIRKLASRRKERAVAMAQASAAAAARVPSIASSIPPAPLSVHPPRMPSVAPAADRYFTLHVLRCLTDGPERYEPVGSRAIIGASGDISLPGEIFVHPREAQLTFEDARLWLEDLEGGNGVFLRIRTPVELSLNDEFVVGDQLLRVEANPPPRDGPDPDPTYFYSSPKWLSSFRVLQVFEGGATGACVVARGSALQIGSAIGDLIFPDDPLVAEQHCIVEEQAGTIVLTDLGSRTGVFVRIRGSQELLHADELLIGRTRLVVDLSRG